MKTSFIFIVTMLLASIAFNFSLLIQLEELNSLFSSNTLDGNEITFIWNDDEESIPVDGSLIRLEFTDENKVFIGPVDTISSN